MPLEIFEFAQGSDEWFQVRCGIPTASEFGTVLPKSRGANKERATYMMSLAAERFLERPGESFESVYTKRGKLMEPEARDLYALTYDAVPRQIGFARSGKMGCSPDSLLDPDGVLEIKSKKADLLVSLLMADQFPEEHKPQCQGALMILEREWVDLCGYWPDLPLFVKRAHRDEPYIANLKREIDRFNEELDRVVERLIHYGEPGVILIADFQKSLALTE